MNNKEIQALRKALILDVAEAAELVGKVRPRTWQHWETGRSPVPSDVEMEMYALQQLRINAIDSELEKIGGRDDYQYTYYLSFEEYKKAFKNHNKMQWRLHQSVGAFLVSEGLARLI